MGIAALGHIGIRHEASFGSGGAVNEYFPFISEDIQLSIGYSYTDKVMGSPNQMGGRYNQESVSGSVTFPVTPQLPNTLFKVGIGQQSSPFSPSRPMTSFAMEIDREDGAVYCSGDVVGSFEMSSEQGGELVATVQIEGKGFKKESSVTSPSFTSGDDAYLHAEARFYINGVETLDVTAFQVTVDHQLQTGLYANQRQRRVIPATKVVVTGQITKLFADADELDTFLAKGTVAISAVYGRGARSLTILINKAHFDAWNAGNGGQSEYILETIPFTGYADDVSEKTILITKV